MLARREIRVQETGAGVRFGFSNPSGNSSHYPGIQNATQRPYLHQAVKLLGSQR